MACKLCHALKVRCIPLDEGDPLLPCQRCVAARRVCEMEPTPKRRRRKTDLERVAELQERVAELEAILAAGAGGQAASVEPQTLLFKDELQFVTSFHLQRFPAIVSSVMQLADQRIKTLRSEFMPRQDAVDLGYLLMAEAEVRINMYRSNYASRFLFVGLDPAATAQHLREHDPLLFHTLLTCTSKMRRVDNTELLNEVRLEAITIQMVMREVLLVGTKLLSILKCLVLISAWGNLPDLFHQRRYHIFQGICVQLVDDLSITGRAAHGYQKQMSQVGRIEAPLDVLLLEVRRVAIAVYVCGVSNALFMRRRVPVEWSPAIEECCVLLRRLPELRDWRLAALCRLVHLLEQIRDVVHVSGELLAPGTRRWAVAQMSQQLEELKPELADDQLLLAYYYSVEAYLYEASEGDATVPVRSEPDEPAEHRLANASGRSQRYPELAAQIERCLRACIQLLRCFSSLPASDLAALPIHVSSRIIYTMGMLLRLRYVCLTGPPALRSVVPPESMALTRAISTTMDAALDQFPSNNTIRKLRLVLALFVQTYVTSIKLILEELSKHKSDLRPALPVAQFTQMPWMRPEERLLFNTATAPEPELVGSDPSVVTPLYSDLAADPTLLENTFNALGSEFWNDLVVNGDDMGADLAFDPKW